MSDSSHDTPLDLAVVATRRQPAMLATLCALFVEAELWIPLSDLPEGEVKESLEAGEPFAPPALTGPDQSRCVPVFDRKPRMEALLEYPMGALRLSGRELILRLPHSASIALNLGTGSHFWFSPDQIARLRASARREAGG